MSKVSKWIKPVDKETPVKESDVLVTKTDKFGNIIYGNKKFFKVTKLDEAQAIGEPHNINRHPDMPKAIFHLLWKTIKRGKNFRGIVKNMTMDGKYYWVITDFEMKKAEDGDMEYYMAYRRGIPQKAKEEIEKIYKEMKSIEATDGMRASLKHLENILADKGISYNDFVENLLKESDRTRSMMGKIKSLFN